MSTYTAAVRLAPLAQAPSHTWVITSADAAPTEADPVLVLDNLSVSWNFPDADLWPCQMDPVSLTVRLLLDDVSTIGDINEGDAGHVKVTSGGTSLVDFAGVIGSMTASVVRRKNTRKVLVVITLVDPIIQAADVSVTVDLPSQEASNRFDSIADAARAEILKNPDLAPALAGGFGGIGSTGVGIGGVTLAPLAATGRVLDLLGDVLTQVAGYRNASGQGAPIMFSDHAADPAVTLGVFNILTGLLASPAAAIRPTGVLALTAHTLGLNFDGLAAAPKGLEIPSAECPEDDVSFTALRFNSVSRVTVTSVDDGSPSVGVKGAGTRQRTITTQMIQPTAVAWTVEDLTTWSPYLLAKRMLPRAQEIRWTLDKFRWRPSDAELADLDYPLVPANVPGYATHQAKRGVLWAPAVITDLAPIVNPTSDSDFYGGTLSSLTFTIRRDGPRGGVVEIVGSIARRLPGVEASTNNFQATYADVITNFPTVKYKSATDVVDPTLSHYEALLARKM